MDKLNRNSFTAASEIPIKLFFHDVVKKIAPIHLQFVPTNRCNLNCDFCSCKARDKNQEIPLEKIMQIIHWFASLGTKSVTITGGGEPLMHPDIKETFDLFEWKEIKIGLVSNGLLLERLEERIGKCVWARISLSKNLPFDKLEKQLDRVMRYKIDWAFSYVVEEQWDIDSLIWCIEYANKNNFTHIRFVNDLMNLPAENKDSLTEIREELNSKGADDHLVIYQPRTNYVSGRNRCLISLLKPIVAADGFIYPCCGVQYAKDQPEADFPQDMRMGQIEDVIEIWSKQKYFDGSKCRKCYYENYNKLLENIKSITHKEFV